MKKSMLVITTLALAIPAAVIAQSQSGNTSYSTQQNIDTMKQHMATANLKSTADALGVTEEEVARYNELTREGSVYRSLGKDLTAIEVLGMEARSESERQRYARMMIEQETRYQKNLLAFEGAKLDVLKQQYPNLSIWYTEEELRQRDLPDLLKGLATFQDKRLVIYASADNCDSECRDYISKVRSSASNKTRVDIFFTNTGGSDKKLRDAVSLIGLDGKDIDGTTLTVNHDKGYFARLEVDAVKTLPMAIKLDRSGQVIPVPAW